MKIIFEVINLNELDAAKMSYRFYCSGEEVERIFNVKSSDDYLLKMRADAVADHVRLMRVIKKRQYLSKNDWNFTNHFSKKEFEQYIMRLDTKNKNKVSKISAGFIFNNDVNGNCIRSDYGDLVVISESLRYFLYFMNLSYADFGDYEVPINVRKSALLIGIRTMLMTEALDFELDPRGIVPSEIHEMNNSFVDRQVEFIIGHEYAHYLLNHLDSRKLTRKKLINLSNHKNDKETHGYQTYDFYNKSQSEEFEADRGSFSLANFSQREFNEYITSVFAFFLHLDLYESVVDTIQPSTKLIKTHPSSIDRIWKLYEYFEDKIISIDRSYLEDIIRDNNKKKSLLQEHIGYNIELYENYGSIYLAEWRGPVLKDRIDY